jgi:hypothetical protein
MTTTTTTTTTTITTSEKQLSVDETIRDLTKNLQHLRKNNLDGLIDDTLCNNLRYLGNEVMQIVACKQS